MTNHPRKLNKLADGGVILSSNPPKVTAMSSIEALEALRDTVQAEEWIIKESQRAVLFGIKMCIARLKQMGINEITE